MIRFSLAALALLLALPAAAQSGADSVRESIEGTIEAAEMVGMTILGPVYGEHDGVVMFHDIDLEANGSYILTVVSPAGADMDPDVFIMDADDDEVVSGYEYGEEEAVTFIAPADGTYSIGITLDGCDLDGACAYGFVLTSL